MAPTGHMSSFVAPIVIWTPSQKGSVLDFFYRIVRCKGDLALSMDRSLRGRWAEGSNPFSEGTVISPERQKNAGVEAAHSIDVLQVTPCLSQASFIFRRTVGVMGSLV